MPQGVTVFKRSAVFMDLGLLDYGRALDLQNRILLSKIDQPSEEDRIIFVEHPPVFTLGKRGGEENLQISREFLLSKGIDVVQTGRGGNITFHGPGQAVMYPIVDLDKHKIGVQDFVHGLEEIMRLTAMDFGIEATRSIKNHGIWVGDSKLGSVGIAIKKGISIHGLAMNIMPDLTPFSWINPCGLANVTMTSLEKEMKALGSPVENLTMEGIKASFIRHFSSLFTYSISS